MHYKLASIRMWIYYIEIIKFIICNNCNKNICTLKMVNFQRNSSAVNQAYVITVNEHSFMFFFSAQAKQDRTVVGTGNERDSFAL